MRHRRRPISTVHDRKPNNRDRRLGGVKAKREGYPALILGQAAATKTLVEIAALEPVGAERLPERQNVSVQNIGFTVRRLVAAGLVRRYQAPGHRDRYLLGLDPRPVWATELRALLQIVASANGQAWHPSPNPDGSEPVTEGPNVTDLKVFGRPNGDVETIFGTPNRTLAVLAVAAAGQMDASTIARLTGVQTDGDMHRLLDPIEADGVFTSEMVGQIRLYSLTREPWTEAAVNLATAILATKPQLQSRVNAARAMVTIGGFSNRIHLRRYLGIRRPGTGGVRRPDE